MCKTEEFKIQAKKLANELITKIESAESYEIYHQLKYKYFFNVKYYNLDVTNFNFKLINHTIKIMQKDNKKIKCIFTTSSNLFIQLKIKKDLK